MTFDVIAGFQSVLYVIYALILVVLVIIIPGVLLLLACDGDKVFMKIFAVWIAIEAFILGGLK